MMVDVVSGNYPSFQYPFNPIAKRFYLSCLVLLRAYAGRMSENESCNSLEREFLPME